MWIDGYEDAFSGSPCSGSGQEYLKGYAVGLCMKDWSQGYDDFMNGKSPQKDTDDYISGYEEAFDDSQEDIGEQDELL